MKSNRRSNRRARDMRSLIVALTLVCALAIGGGVWMNNLAGASAETASAPAPAPVQDTSPAIYVNEKNANSVVGIITNAQGW